MDTPERLSREAPRPQVGTFPSAEETIVQDNFAAGGVYLGGHEQPLPPELQILTPTEAFIMIRALVYEHAGSDRS